MNCRCDHNEWCEDCMPKRDPKDVEIARLTARIAELEKALRDIAEAKMPGQARYIARTTLEASERGGGE